MASLSSSFLSSVFAIDICAYVVMSNHYHVVLHVDKNRAENWTKQEVVERKAEKDIHNIFLVAEINI